MIVAAIVWLIVTRDGAAPHVQPWTYVGKILLIGVTIGGLWEGFEWAIGIIGSLHDSVIDLVMDMVGTALAAMFCFLAAGYEKRRSPTD